MQRTPDRLVAVDAFRGIVMFLLLPDLTGGFSFHSVARQLPDDPFWSRLAAQFTHVQWSGASIWDFVMPSFVLLVGIAMPLSAAARRARGDTEMQILGHVILRAAVLVLLAQFLHLVEFRERTYLDELWPFILLGAGLPVPRQLANSLGITSQKIRYRIELAWWAIILAASVLRLTAKFGVLDIHFNHIFSQLGLASIFAFLLVGKGRRVQVSSISVILILYWLLFALFPLQGPGLDPYQVGVQSGNEVFEGLFAHWNKNSNAATAFDVWFLNHFPQPEPFLFQEKGLQTLNFVPTIATMICGVMAGELLASCESKVRIRNLLFVAGAGLTIGGLIAGQWLCPIVKAIWTPSWALFSTGVVILVLAALYQFCGLPGGRTWAMPFAVLGTNSILLYVLAYYKWRFLSITQRVTGIDITAGIYTPVLQSLVLLGMLWAIAYVLYRARTFVKI